MPHAGHVYRHYGQEAFDGGEMPPLDAQVIRTSMGFHIRGGRHDLAAQDWRSYMGFVDACGRAKRATTALRP